jgi:hypothetical protein
MGESIDEMNAKRMLKEKRLVVPSLRAQGGKDCDYRYYRLILETRDEMMV